MDTEILDSPADLAVWSSADTARPVTAPIRFESLREALRAAAGLLDDPARQPWIVTADGEMLAPVSIRRHLN